MFKRQFHVIVICLVGTLAVAILAPAPLSAQEVVLIFGSGFSPGGLTEGSRPPGGTQFIEADSQTIVVLKRNWALDEGVCEDWIILRGGRYRIETSTPGDCPKRGSGDEIARAMGGESMVAHLTLPVLGFSDPKADFIGPQELERLRSDLYKLRKKAEEEAEKPAPKPHVYQLQEDLKVDQGTKVDGAAIRERVRRDDARRRAELAEVAEREAARKAPLKRDKRPAVLVKSSFSSFQRGTIWFVGGKVVNISGRSLDCVRLRFKMRTSYQAKERGAVDLDLGVLEVEVRDLAVGEERSYHQALAAQVGLSAELSEECQ